MCHSLPPARLLTAPIHALSPLPRFDLRSKARSEREFRSFSRAGREAVDVFAAREVLAGAGGGGGVGSPPRPMPTPWDLFASQPDFERFGGKCRGRLPYWSSGGSEVATDVKDCRAGSGDRVGSSPEKGRRAGKGGERGRWRGDREDEDEEEQEEEEENEAPPRGRKEAKLKAMTAEFQEEIRKLREIREAMVSKDKASERTTPSPPPPPPPQPVAPASAPPAVAVRTWRGEPSGAESRSRPWSMALWRTTLRSGSDLSGETRVPGSGSRLHSQPRWPSGPPRLCLCLSLSSSQAFGGQSHGRGVEAM